MRLFFAVELPREVQTVLGRLAPPDAGRDYRWVDARLMHVTLAFLGEQPEDRLEALRQIGATAATRSRRGALRLGTAGNFGSRRAPRVLWVDVGGDVATLATLQTNVTDGLAGDGFVVEERPYQPHITLARRRQTAMGGAPPGWPPSIEPMRFEMNALTLMHSRLSPRGPTYTVVGDFPLGS